MFAIQNSKKAVDYIRKRFPEIQEAFEKAMEEYVKTGTIGDFVI